MIELDIGYENCENGIMIVDYSDEDNIRYCGKSFAWSYHFIIDDPFDSKYEAEDAAHKYFTGK